MAESAEASPGRAVVRPSLMDVFRAFLLVGVTSFGGGRATYFHEELVRKRCWLSEADFLEAVAISQVLPGPNIGNLAAYLGQRMRGAAGAFIAVACLTVPGGVAILVLAWFYYNGMPASVTGPVGRGVSAASVGLAAAAVIRLRGGAGGAPGYAIAVGTFLLFGPFGWPIHYVLLIVLPVSFGLAWKRRPA